MTKLAMRSAAILRSTAALLAAGLLLFGSVEGFAPEAPPERDRRAVGARLEVFFCDNSTGDQARWTKSIEAALARDDWAYSGIVRLRHLDKSADRGGGRRLFLMINPGRDLRPDEAGEIRGEVVAGAGLIVCLECLPERQVRGGWPGLERYLGELGIHVREDAVLNPEGPLVALKTRQGDFVQTVDTAGVQLCFSDEWRAFAGISSSARGTFEGTCSLEIRGDGPPGRMLVVARGPPSSFQEDATGVGEQAPVIAAAWLSESPTHRDRGDGFVLVLGDTTWLELDGDLLRKLLVPLLTRGASAGGDLSHRRSHWRRLLIPTALALSFLVAYYGLRRIMPRRRYPHGSPGVINADRPPAGTRFR